MNQWHYVSFFLLEIISLITVSAFVIILTKLLLKRKNNRVKKFMKQTNVSTWPTKRIYVDEKSGNFEFFIDPVSKKKIYYDLIEVFGDNHHSPAHIEIIFDTRVGYLKKTRVAYISGKKWKELARNMEIP